MYHGIASAKQILDLLSAGSSLTYFYLDGGVGIHDQKNVPMKKEDGGFEFCEIKLFLELCQKEFIVQTEQKEHGYPYYANRTKYAIYRITDKGKEYAKSL